MEFARTEKNFFSRYCPVKMQQDNILYFLCKSAGGGVESGKNVFDFIKKCIYNGRYQWIFALFYEERLRQEQNGKGHTAMPLD
ncbi:iron-sulfur flavoprotein [Clostridium sp. M62/1]|uniref:hypothetical protein n=1 Tax=unclassified Clostridium TaxID=2614128 RepID=UPI0001973488|nr:MULTISPECIES: hypothetical protein [unclassified Clostridium]MBS5467439.1 iron-sulfur flavoprotein [Clostridium sp.]CBK76240.1 hypothetical protein CLS_04160 [[Clostridium] cf. saccharolyticum K10]HJG83394.1 iron-sulfur flavoprotein [Lacrimispora saccharolytica]EFE11155.1 hypothetical protein CLOM621_08628 [Clostridium sp. M62/1]RHT55389.1 iron-sulfur flavoprotein [Clostridium sp. AM29-11AC]